MDEAGPSVVEPKVLENPIVDSATPTEEGLVRVVCKVRVIPPAGSLAGRSNESTLTSPLKPFMPASTTCANKH